MTSPRQRNTTLRLLYAAAIAALVVQLVAQLANGSLGGAPAIALAAACVGLAAAGERRLARERRRSLESVSAMFGETESWTYEHSTRVCDYALMIGRELGMEDDELTRLMWAARLHDIGKVAIDDAILNKPGKLTDEEFEAMKRHPEVSARILAAFGCDETTIEIVRCHHERWDGRGYLRRERHAVPIESFIIGIADAYDAMTSDRPYRKALPDEVALPEIHRNLRTQFHPQVGAIFLTAMGFAGESAALPIRGADVGSAGPDRVATPAAAVIEEAA